MSLEDVLEFIAVANLVFLLVNRIYLDQARHQRQHKAMFQEFSGSNYTSREGSF
ncbi:hypothetical protein YC2023_116048 [Brassica napus]